jgi:hypothetical protein
MFMALALSACADQTGMEPSVADTSVQATGAAQGQTDEQLSQAPLIGETPVMEGETAAQPEILPDPGAGENESPIDPGDPQGQPGGGAVEVLPSGEWLTYSGENLGFTVAYPPDYVVRPMDAQTAAQFQPQPEAVVDILEPAKANSDVAELEIPDLSIRVFALPADTSLEGWLDTTGLGSAASGAVLSAHQSNGLTGLRVCASTDIAPNCSVYFLGSGRVYQLTPSSQAGEAMLQTFALSG